MSLSRHADKEPVMSLTEARQAKPIKPIINLREAELAMSGVESASYATIFLLFLKRAWLYSLRALAVLLLPLIAVMELGQAGIAIYQAHLYRNPRSIAKAIIYGVSAAAVTSVVVGTLMLLKGVVTAGTYFLATALPWVLGGAMVAKGMYDLALAARSWYRTRNREIKGERFHINNHAKEHLLRAVSSIVVGVVFTALMVAALTNPICLAILGGVGAVGGIGYAATRFTDSRRLRENRAAVVVEDTLGARLSPDVSPSSSPKPENNAAADTARIQTSLGIGAPRENQGDVATHTVAYTEQQTTYSEILAPLHRSGQTGSHAPPRTIEDNADDLMRTFEEDSSLLPAARLGSSSS